MDAIYRLGASMDPLKSLTKDFFGYYPLCNGFSPDVQVRRGRRISRDTAWVSKMGFIVAASACHGKRHCKASASSSCTPHPLLIVETLGWHVPHHNSQQSTDIHAGFHGRRNTEQVDGIHTVYLWRKTHTLKQPLPPSGVFVVGLAGELFTVEPEGRSI
jgi:hypothetical protein